MRQARRAPPAVGVGRGTPAPAAATDPALAKRLIADEFLCEPSQRAHDRVQGPEVLNTWSPHPWTRLALDRHHGPRDRTAADRPIDHLRHPGSLRGHPVRTECRLHHSRYSHVPGAVQNLEPRPVGVQKAGVV